MLRRGLANLINSFDGYTVEAGDRTELMQQLEAKDQPDVDLPEMDGYETAEWLRNTYPQVNILALSMMDSESAYIRMIGSGVRGYIERYGTG